MMLFPLLTENKNKNFQTFQNAVLFEAAKQKVKHCFLFFETLRPIIHRVSNYFYYWRIDT